MTNIDIVKNMQIKRTSHQHHNYAKTAESFYKRQFSTEKLKPTPVNKSLIIKKPIYPLFEKINLKNFPFEEQKKRSSHKINELRYFKDKAHALNDFTCSIRDPG